MRFVTHYYHRLPSTPDLQTSREPTSAQVSDDGYPPEAKQRSTSEERKFAPLRAPRPNQTFPWLLPSDLIKVQPLGGSRITARFYRALQPDGSWKLFQRDVELANYDLVDAEAAADKYLKARKAEEKRIKKEEEQRKKEERQKEKNARFNFMGAILDKRLGGLAGPRRGMACAASGDAGGSRARTPPPGYTHGRNEPNDL